MIQVLGLILIVLGILALTAVIPGGLVAGALGVIIGLLLVATRGHLGA